jgi:membrane protein implicated in regulation of membrane protease activity
MPFWFEFYINHILASIIITWLYNRSRGSILVAGVAHTAANTSLAFLPNLDWGLYTVMLAIIALLLVLIDRMWKRLPQEDPAVSHAPRLAV